MSDRSASEAEGCGFDPRPGYFAATESRAISKRAARLVSFSCELANGQTFSRPSSLRYLIGVFTKNTSPGGAALPHAGAGRPRGVMEEKTPSSP